ncbi:hypothetical protein [Bacillus sp. ISL-39]|uniref:hypothetical protein n=1 Tax=Bacillus sp. ISL-39 TaxID=2819124 RepID=UPI001BECB9CD|nr:hypothetical protein [Bacillus sp. ISL-39]MBT2636580.1 hypothetical protein [Bacillus sp. ISL-39]
MIKKDKAYFFLKFGQRKYMMLLQQGNLHMKNLKYFISYEEEMAKKGRGDKYEGAMVLNDVRMQFRSPKTDEVFFEIYSARTQLRDDSVLTKPVFCMTYISGEDLEVINETDNYYEAKIKFSDQLKEEMASEFGDTVLVMSAGNFLDRIKEVFEEEGLVYGQGKVDYYDYNINHSKRLQYFEEGNNPMIFFTKDELIAYQKEFRIVVLDKDTEDHLDIDIGDITPFSGLADTRAFLNDNIVVRIMKNHDEGN